MRERGDEGGILGKGEREKSDLVESLPRTTQSRKIKPTIQVSCELKLDLAQESY